MGVAAAIEQAPVIQLRPDTAATAPAACCLLLVSLPSLAMGAVPSLILLFGSMMLPDTPNSLVQRGRVEDGRKVLQKIRGTQHVDVEFEDIQEAVAVSANVKNPFLTIIKRRYWCVAWVGVGVGGCVLHGPPSLNP
jgi:hypothetical protein